jgi:hypothetical protein
MIDDSSFIFNFSTYTDGTNAKMLQGNWKKVEDRRKKGRQSVIARSGSRLKAGMTNGPDDSTGAQITT